MRLLGLVTLTLASLAMPGRAAYPDRPVRIVVATTPGGGYDLVGRLIAEQLHQNVGGTYVVENVPGAGSLIGTRSVAKQAPDGYTLLIGGLSNIVLNMGLYANPGYQPDKDFVPIALVYTIAYAMVARNDLPDVTLKGIIDFARKNPGKLNVATAGPGTGQDVLATLFASLAGIKVTKIPYRGAASIYPDLMAGRVDVFIDALSTALPQVQAGSVRMIATLGPARSPRMPDAPTVAEAGLPDLTAESWLGLFAPAKTPPAVGQALREGLARSVADPAFRQKVESTGGDLMQLVGDQAREKVDTELAKWLPMMKRADIVPQ